MERLISSPMPPLAILIRSARADSAPVWSRTQNKKMGAHYLVVNSNPFFAFTSVGENFLPCAQHDPQYCGIC